MSLYLPTSLSKYGFDLPLYLMWQKFYSFSPSMYMNECMYLHSMIYTLNLIQRLDDNKCNVGVLQFSCSKSYFCWRRKFSLEGQSQVWSLGKYLLWSCNDVNKNNDNWQNSFLKYGYFLKKWAISWFFFVFSTNNHRDSNPRSSEHESLPISARTGQLNDLGNI